MLRLDESSSMRRPDESARAAAQAAVRRLLESVDQMAPDSFVFPFNTKNRNAQSAL
jgi:hypothetical protein